MRIWESFKRHWRGRSWPVRRDIMENDGRPAEDSGRLYLRRWHLIGGQYNPWFSLMLHRICLPDETCHHDHPWDFLTVILRGGYWEEVTQEDGSVTRQWNGPGSVLYRRAEHTHRIEQLPNGDAWTLVFRFKRRRDWGFHVPDVIGGWVPWRTFKEMSDEFTNWCGDWLDEHRV